MFEAGDIRVYVLDTQWLGALSESIPPARTWRPCCLAAWTMQTAWARDRGGPTALVQTNHFAITCSPPTLRSCPALAGLGRLLRRGGGSLTPRLLKDTFGIIWIMRSILQVRRRLQHTRRRRVHAGSRHYARWMRIVGCCERCSSAAVNKIADADGAKRWRDVWPSR